MLDWAFESSQLHIEYHNIRYWMSLHSIIKPIFKNFYLITFKVVTLNSKCFIMKYFICHRIAFYNKLKIEYSTLNYEYWAADRNIRTLQALMLIFRLVVPLRIWNGQSDLDEILIWSYKLNILHRAAVLFPERVPKIQLKNWQKQ